MIQPQLNSTLIPPHARAQSVASSNGNAVVLFSDGLGVNGVKHLIGTTFYVN